MFSEINIHVTYIVHVYWRILLADKSFKELFLIHKLLAGMDCITDLKPDLEEEHQSRVELMGSLNVTWAGVQRTKWTLPTEFVDSCPINWN